MIYNKEESQTLHWLYFFEYYMQMNVISGKYIISIEYY
jgi:hypothetical protein